MKKITCPWSNSWDMIICSEEKAKGALKYLNLIGIPFREGAVGNYIGQKNSFTISPTWYYSQEFKAFYSSIPQEILALGTPKIWIGKDDVEMQTVMMDYFSIMESENES